jgi:hypothetical protein
VKYRRPQKKTNVGRGELDAYIFRQKKKALFINGSSVSGNIWENNIKTDLREQAVRMGGGWNMGQDRVQWRALVLAVLNLRVLLPDVVN